MFGNPKDMALMFYVADAKERFSKYNDKVLEKLAKEISALSLTIDISAGVHEFKKGEIKRAIEIAQSWNDNRKLVNIESAGDSNVNVKIKGRVIKHNVSPLYLMALMTYCINKIKGGDLAKMQGFDYLKMGEVL